MLKKENLKSAIYLSIYILKFRCLSMDSFIFKSSSINQWLIH